MKPIHYIHLFLTFHRRTHPMLSYLCNRHYHTLTQLLPPELRPNQPELIYYKTFIDENTLSLLRKNQKVTHRTLASRHKKNTNTTKKPSDRGAYQDKDACPICMEKHIPVEYYGHKHICSKCRSFVRDEHCNQVKIFLNEQREIVCLGIYPKESRQQMTKYYVTDHTKLQVTSMSVYATFAGPEQLVLILRDKKDLDTDQ